MTKTDEPFVLIKRKHSSYYQVLFKNPDKTSKTRYLAAKTTGETDLGKAKIRAWEMYSKKEVEKQSLFDAIRHSDYDKEEAINILELLKKRGFIENYILTDSPQSILLTDFLSDFWTPEKSSYLKEKVRHNKKLSTAYIRESFSFIERFWTDYFQNRYLGDISRKDLKDFIDFVDTFDLSWNRKLKIYRAGAIALKWAFYNELISKDITAGISSFSGKSKERKILSKEIAELLFSYQWKDIRSELANMVSMLTGLRVGEVRALRLKSLGKDCLYIDNSWSRLDHLKETKNGESRVVRFPFPKLIEKMKFLVSLHSNPNLNTFIFWSEVKPEQPLESSVFLKALRNELRKIGLSKEDSESYCFHSWRHFYTTYMADNVSQRILQSQTGHKTLEMLEHYSNHQTDDEIAEIEKSQLSIFGNIVNKSILNKL